MYNRKQDVALNNNQFVSFLRKFNINLQTWHVNQETNTKLNKKKESLSTKNKIIYTHILKHCLQIVQIYIQNQSKQFSAEMLGLSGTWNKYLECCLVSTAAYAGLQAGAF